MPYLYQMLFLFNCKLRNSGLERKAIVKTAHFGGQSGLFLWGLAAPHNALLPGVDGGLGAVIEVQFF